MAGENRLVKAILEKPYLLTLGLAGLLVIAAGLAIIGLNFPKNNPPELEIVATRPEITKIMIDIGGAVVNPGIYELGPDSRLNDALVLAGGIDPEANHDWVSQNVNLAQKLTDGEKVYIPFREEESAKVSPSRSKGETLNINTASLTELDQLWGVGPVTAQKIIDNRPYSKINDLLDKKVVKTNVFEAIKDKISVL